MTWSILISTKSSIRRRKPAWMSKDILPELKRVKITVQEVEVGVGDPGRTKSYAILQR